MKTVIILCTLLLSLCCLADNPAGGALLISRPDNCTLSISDIKYSNDGKNNTNFNSFKGKPAGTSSGNNLTFIMSDPTPSGPLYAEYTTKDAKGVIHADNMELLEAGSMMCTLNFSDGTETHNIYLLAIYTGNGSSYATFLLSSDDFEKNGTSTNSMKIGTYTVTLGTPFSVTIAKSTTALKI